MLIFLLLTKIYAKKLREYLHIIKHWPCCYVSTPSPIVNTSPAGSEIENGEAHSMADSDST